MMDMSMGPAMGGFFDFSGELGTLSLAIERCN